MSGIDTVFHRKLNSKLCSLPRNSTLLASGIVATYIFFIFACIGIGWIASESLFSIYALVIKIMLGVFIGTRLRGINNIAHECSHYSFVENRSRNVFFGKLCSALLFRSYVTYQEEHRSHHSNLGDCEKDKDFRRLQPLGIEKELTFYRLMLHLVRPIAGLHILYYVTVDMRMQDGKIFGVFKLAWAAFLVILVWLQPGVMFWLIILPYFWIYPAINYWTDCVDHGGLLNDPHLCPLNMSRNFVASRLLRLALFPRNDCFHLIHHLYPTLPVRYFDDVHSALLGNAEYRRRHSTA